MIVVLLPLGIALMLALGVLLDPVRTVAAVYLGTRDYEDRSTVLAAVSLSLACGGLYLLLFGWTYASPAEFLSRSLLVGPGLCVLTALAVNWMRRAANGRLTGV